MMRLLSQCIYISMCATTGVLLLVSRQDEDAGQVPNSLHGETASGAGSRVRTMYVHHVSAQTIHLTRDRTIRATDQDLVSEQARQGSQGEASTSGQAAVAAGRKRNRN